MEVKYQKDEPIYSEILWKRAVFAYASSAGNLLIVAGSGLESKEALLTAEAAFQSGTGILTLAFPLSLEKSYKDFIPKEMLLPLPETPSRSISIKAKEKVIDFSTSNKVTILGPGLSKNSETSHLIWELIFNLEGNIIVSGDAIRTLNIGLKLIFDKEGLEGVNNYFKNAKGKLFIILNDNDLHKLNFEKEKLGLNELIAKVYSDFGVTLVAYEKNELSLGSGEIIMTKIDEELGNGDFSVLSGLVGSFLSQNLDKPKEAIATAIYIFSKAFSLSSQTGKSLPSQIKIAIKAEE